MSKKVIDKDLLLSDLRSATARIRATKTKLDKTINKNDVFLRIEQIFKSRGYTSFGVNIAKQLCVINVTSNIDIYGRVEKFSLKFGFWIKFDALNHTSESLSCGLIEFPIYYLEHYESVIDKMIDTAKYLTSRYESLRKCEKSAELLETLVQEYLKDIRNLYVTPDEQGVMWLISNVGDNVLISVPIDFNNYKSQCETWLNVVNNPNLWSVEHKDTGVQVLKSRTAYANHIEWRNFATGEIYYGLKI